MFRDYSVYRVPVHPAFRAEIKRNALVGGLGLEVGQGGAGFTKVWESGSEASFSRGVMTAVGDSFIFNLALGITLPLASMASSANGGSCLV